MVKTHDPPHRSSASLAGLVVLGVPGAASASTRKKTAPKPPPRPPVVTLLGDSITAGIGVATSLALPARLQAALDRMSIRALVRGFGKLGDTTSGGLSARRRRAPRDHGLRRGPGRQRLAAGR
ncbi:hypothetical protein ACRAWD_31105 [Caulobacter segnis]